MGVTVETPQKIRFLKYIYEQNCPVKPGDIAIKFGIKTATVTRSLHDLRDAGYLNYELYQKVQLTEVGTELARYLYRRHRILSLMFTRAGLSESDACMTSEKIEHLIAREFIDKICRSLGHPSRAACGSIDHDPACCGVC
jgi:DtxR family Mn-dependent transcriptional regulator